MAALLVTLLAALLALGAGCQEKSECKTVCRRVAVCRSEARQGRRMLGEKRPKPDARCMKRCQNDRDSFEKCELINRNCQALRSCYGPLR